MLHVFMEHSEKYLAAQLETNWRFMFTDLKRDYSLTAIYL